MGEDKALMRFRGELLIQRVLRRLDGLADEVLITTNRPESYGFLDLKLAIDLPGVDGALGGLYTALLSAAQPVVAVTACDMPFVNAALMRAQIALLMAGDDDVVIPHPVEGYEPFHAVYRRETCLQAVKNALEAGQRKMTAWFPNVRIHEILTDELREYDPELRSFINLNTPEDFTLAEELAEQLGDG